MAPHPAQPARYVPFAFIVNALAFRRRRAYAISPGLAGAIVLAIMAVFWPLRAIAEGKVHILALGDSLTAGYGLPADEAFPARLEAALKARGLDVAVINAGVSGDTTAGGKARIQWSLGGAPKPDAAIVALGSNDGLRGIEPAEMRANLKAILEALDAADVPTLLAGMKAPRNFGPEYVEEFDAVFPELAESYDTLYYPFLLESVALARDLNQDDGIHPNEKGVARMVQGILPLAEQLVARARAGMRKEGK